MTTTLGDALKTTLNALHTLLDKRTEGRNFQKWAEKHNKQITAIDFNKYAPQTKSQTPEEVLQLAIEKGEQHLVNDLLSYDRTLLDRVPGEVCADFAEMQRQGAQTLLQQAQAQGSAPGSPQMRAAQIFALDYFRALAQIAKLHAGASSLQVPESNDVAAQRTNEALELAHALLGRAGVEDLRKRAQSKGLGALITDAWHKVPGEKHEQLMKYFLLRAIGEQGGGTPNLDNLDKAAEKELTTLQQRWLAEQRTSAMQQLGRLEIVSQPTHSRGR